MRPQGCSARGQADGVGNVFLHNRKTLEIYPQNLTDQELLAGVKADPGANTRARPALRQQGAAHKAGAKVCFTDSVQLATWLPDSHGIMLLFPATENAAGQSNGDMAPLERSGGQEQRADEG